MGYGEWRYNEKDPQRSSVTPGAYGSKDLLVDSALYFAPLRHISTLRTVAPAGIDSAKHVRAPSLRSGLHLDRIAGCAAAPDAAALTVSLIDALTTKPEPALIASSPVDILSPINAPKGLLLYQKMHLVPSRVRDRHHRGNGSLSHRLR